ncbi:MAG: eukaryotic-like serine/threonine-protein kinase [Blastocatellia bacterium]
MTGTDRWPQVEEILHHALGLPRGERAAYLIHACGGDEALRKEVESLLAFDEPEDGFLESPAPPLVDADLEPAAGIAPGHRIGAYEVAREIGTGGMGAVYEAVRADDQYRKQVAIKLIKRGMDTDFILRRFRNERQILANLDHPNIARLLDGGATEDGLPYLVMEYIEGQPITEYADERSLPTAERLKLFRSVCAAVEYAHQHLVIHRDIKPNNILVTAEGVPKLLDFGISKLLSTDRSGDTATATAMRLMTPEYASPEQVKGEAITTASDVYSLGVLLYELLTGHRPYRLKSRAPHEVFKAVIEEQPEKPSVAVTHDDGIVSREGATRSPLAAVSTTRRREGQPAKLRRRLRGDLDNIVLMALRKEAGRRYASTAEFSEDVRRHLEGLPVIARKDTFVYRGAKFIRRHRAAFLAASAVALLCLLAGVALFWLIQSRKPVDSVAVLPFVNVNHDAGAEYLARGISNHLLDRLSEMPNLRVTTRTAAARYDAEASGFDPQAAGRALNVGVVLIGRLDERDNDIAATVELFDVGQNHDLWHQQYHYKRSDMLRLEDDLAREVVEKLGLKLSGQDERLLMRRYTDDVEAYQLYLKGRYFWDRRVEGSLEQSLICYQQAIAKDPNYALAYAGLAQAYDTLGYLTPPTQTYPRAEAAAQAALRLDETLPEAHTMLAILNYKYRWNQAQAEKEFRRALQLDPNDAATHMYYASFLMENGRLGESLIESDTALRLDPLNLVINSNRAIILVSSRRYAEAIEQCRKTLQIESRLAAAHVVLARALAQQRQFVEALGELREGMKYGGGIEYQAATAYTYAMMGERREAERTLSELLKLSKQRYVQPFWIATAYAGLGDKDRAFEFLEKGLAEHSPWMIHLNNSPEFNSLRSDPRFLDLLRRINLVP